MPRISRTLLSLFMLSLAYAVVRYQVFGGVAPGQFPVYVVNKAVSVTAVLALLCAGLAYRRKDPERCRQWGRASIHLAGLHVLLSFTILSPAYFKKFYGEDLRFHWKGETMLLSGVLAAYVYWLIFRGGREAGTEERNPLICAAGALICIHLISMGLPGWLHPGAWYGGMPPISLLGFLVTVAAIIAYSRKCSGTKGQ